VEGNYSRLEQVEDRISELEDEIEIKEKKRRNLSERIQEFCREYGHKYIDSIKRPNMRIMGIEDEEVHTTGVCNIFNKIITEIFTNLKKVMSIQVQEASRLPGPNR
jgi:L-lactate utilization protein LutC